MKRRKSGLNLHYSLMCQENESPVPVDRISDLPDPILGSILSLLPTKNAVATSILSKRWKFVCRAVDSLVFYHLGSRVEPSEGKDMRFVEFVNRVLLLHGARFLNTFVLFWKPRCVLFHVRSWINTAIKKNVHKLVLCLETRDGADSSPEPIEMPLSIFNCDSLRSLELIRGVFVSDANVICLPRLEILILESVYFESREGFEKLLKGCPLLTYLYLLVDMDYMVEYFGATEDEGDSFTYIVSSSSLKSFQLSVSSKLVLPRHKFYCSLELLEAPSLEYLKLDGFIWKINVHEVLSSLVEADLWIDLEDTDYHETFVCDSVVEVVRALNCAKTITLSGAAMWALSHAEISLSTDFKRLLEFETELYCCHCCWPLRDIIQCSDNLEVLAINQDPNSLCSRDLHVHSNWKAPVEVPKCLSNSLKTIIVDVYCGFADEREMIRYLLMHGSVLEVMKIKCDRSRDDTKFDLIQDICKFPRKSPACEVEFIVDQCSPDSVSGSNGNSRVNMTADETDEQ